jgi:hypothetical protein
MLVELAARGGYDTDKSEAYLHEYELLLAPLRERDVRLLELGVLRGGSLALWRDFFPRGRIAGLDREPGSVDDPSGRIATYRGEQDDLALLDRIAAEVAPDGFDVVIDDASHVAAPTRTSFWHLFEHHLKSGGIYVVEDWGTGYFPAYPDGRAYDGTQHTAGMVGFVKELVDEVGIADATHPVHGTPPQRESRIARVQIAFGQAFVVKAEGRREDAA